MNWGSFQTVRKTVTLIGLLLCGLSAGCATTQIDHSWKSPAVGGKTFQKVLVIGMAKRPDVRRTYEDAMVDQLRTAGVAGVASYSLLPDAQMTDKAAVNQAIAQSGADAVLMTRLVKRVEQDVVVPPSPRMQEYIDTAWPGTYTPTVAGQTDIVTLETKLFEAGSGRLAWSATTQTFDAQDLQRAISGVSRTITRELAKQHLI